MHAWNKLDSSLASIYSDYLWIKEHGGRDLPLRRRRVAESGRIHVSLQYAGDLAAVEALGFQTAWKGAAGRATGIVNLATLEDIAEHPGVLHLSFGEEPDLLLDVSVPDIGADQVWHFAGGTFTGTTGANAIVGIIDTGIDFRHAFFRKTDSPKTTRILRIWDQGLVKQPTESSPDATLLSGEAGPGVTYGVEYTKQMIDDVLQGVSPSSSIRHQDCVGHGTHVASIAAGDGRTEFKYKGVAPEANLVIVKHLALQNAPESSPGAAVDSKILFRDAVAYIRNVAKTIGLPVAINCSFGNNMGPHDGFTENEDWLTTHFQGAVGEVLVSAAGNDGRKQQHARIEFPAGVNSVDIPLELYDNRGAKKIAFDTCEWSWGTRPLKVQLYYEGGGPTLTAGIQIPDGSGTFHNGPDLNDPDPPPIIFSGRQCKMRHRTETPTTLLNGVDTVNRNVFEVTIDPFRNRHVVGKYTLRVKASDALTVHLWCRQVRGVKKGHGFRVQDTPRPPAVVTIEDNGTIGSNGGARNVITVGAYSAEDPGTPVADLTSRGPLVDYHGPLQPDKPDLAAPGVKIDAAKGIDSPPWPPTKTVPKGGTSMAAPHVTGAAALLFDKDPTLTVDLVTSALKGNARPTAAPDNVDDIGAGRLDAQQAANATP